MKSFLIGLFTIMSALVMLSACQAQAPDTAGDTPAAAVTINATKATETTVITLVPTTTTAPPADPAVTAATAKAIVGNWTGGYSLNDMLNFETEHTLFQSIDYTIHADGTFTGTAYIPDEEIELFLDNVMAEHGKTCEEMFGTDRATITTEVQTFSAGTIDDGTYTVNGNTITMTASGYTFQAVLTDGVLLMDDGGWTYSCTKTS